MSLSTSKETISQTLEVIKSATCDGCTDPVTLPEHIVNRPVRTSMGILEIVDGLHVTLGGGYLGFFDGQDVNIILCTKCSEKLIDTFPNFKVLMDVE